MRLSDHSEVTGGRPTDRRQGPERKVGRLRPAAGDQQPLHLEGEVAEESEVLLLLKTRQELYPSSRRPSSLCTSTRLQRSFYCRWTGACPPTSVGSTSHLAGLGVKEQLCPTDQRRQASGHGGKAERALMSSDTIQRDARRHQRAVLSGVERWNATVAMRSRCHSLAFSGSDVSDRKARSGEHVIDPHQRGSNGTICDQVISKALPRAAAPSVTPASRMARKPRLPHVALKSPTTSSPSACGREADA